MAKRPNYLKEMLKAVKMPKVEERKRPMYNKAAYHNGRISATNGAALIEIYQDYPEELEGRYTDANGVLNEKERPADSHIRARENNVDRIIYPIAMLTQADIQNLNTAFEASKEKAEEESLNLLSICGRYLDFGLFCLLLNAVKKFTKGDFIVKIEDKESLSKNYKPLLFEATDGSVKFVIMPVIVTSDKINVTEYKFSEF